ncbi:MAG TPA: hypothetical protein VFV43_10605 [Limnobacter sp.]|nr:hypothetical protein [Limnobacter sp.]
MSERTRLNLDFSTALPLSHYIQSPAPRQAAGQPASIARPVFGFEYAEQSQKTTGPCALAVILDYHEIGWSHLPLASDGHPESKPYLQEVMRWSETPDQADIALDTSPTAMLKALGKAGLIAHCYHGANEPQAAELYMRLLEHELSQGRPVIALLREHTPKCNSTKPVTLIWQVVWKIGENSVWTKTTQARNANAAWGAQAFTEMLQTPYPGVGHVAITAEKPMPI